MGDHQADQGQAENQLMAPTLTASNPPINPDVSDIWKTQARIRTSQRETPSIRFSDDRLQVSITSFQLRTSSPGLLDRSTGCETAIVTLLTDAGTDPVCLARILPGLQPTAGRGTGRPFVRRVGGIIFTPS
jgi:hypothetical protein